MRSLSLFFCAALLAVACSSAPKALVNTRWAASQIGGLLVAEGSHPTLEFAPDDKVMGQGGCNRYGGGVKFDNTSLKFEGIAATRMACADPAVMHQETQLFAAFSATHSFRKEGSDLVLLDIDGKTVARFKPQ